MRNIVWAVLLILGLWVCVTVMAGCNDDDDANQFTVGGTVRANGSGAVGAGTIEVFRGGRRIQTTAINANGAFVFNNVRTGTYTVVVNRTLNGVLVREVIPNGLQVTGNTSNLAFDVCDPAEIGTVVQPAPGTASLIIVGRNAAGGLLSEVTVNVQGQTLSGNPVTFSPLSASSSQTVTVTFDGFTQTQPIPLLRDVVTVWCPVFSTQGAVFSATGAVSQGGNAVSGGTVAFVQNGVVRQTGTIQANGTFTVQNLQPGDYEVVVIRTVNGITFSEQIGGTRTVNANLTNLSLAATTDADLTNLSLSQPGVNQSTLVVYATDQNGNQLDDVSVQIDANTPVTADSPVMITNITADTTPRTVRVAVDGQTRTYLVTFVSQQITVLNVQFGTATTATITGRVVNMVTNDPVQGATVSLQQAGANVGTSATTDVNGNYTINNPATGTYTIAVTGTGIQPAFAGSVVVSSSTTTLISPDIQTFTTGQTVGGQPTTPATGESLAVVFPVQRSGATTSPVSAIVRVNGTLVTPNTPNAPPLVIPIASPQESATITAANAATNPTLQGTVSNVPLPANTAVAVTPFMSAP